MKIERQVSPLKEFNPSCWDCSENALCLVVFNRSVQSKENQIGMVGGGLTYFRRSYPDFPYKKLNNNLKVIWVCVHDY